MFCLEKLNSDYVILSHIKFKRDTVFLLEIWEIPYNTGHPATLVLFAAQEAKPKFPLACSDLQCH
jgi:hypothetical protein